MSGFGLGGLLLHLLDPPIRPSHRLCVVGGMPTVVSAHILHSYCFKALATPPAQAQSLVLAPPLALRHLNKFYAI